jgi:hypothetical protein
MKIAFMKKLRVDYIRGMLATIWFKIFYHLASCLKTRTLDLMYKTMISQRQHSKNRNHVFPIRCVVFTANNNNNIDLKSEVILGL